MDTQNKDVPQDSTLEQVSSALQSGKNILITVSTNPSVDELSSALGLTFLLGKIDKNTTAVFSGKIPPAMEFLDPSKTFEGTIDSLRDFIVALDRDKADKLRYKLEEDVVKIFITPYKTVIDEGDLQFSQGDFNVDVVMALGVEKRDDLDKAIISHGRILHDAIVIGVTAGTKQSSLGSINWHDSGASSVSEMIVYLGEKLGKDLLDSQTSNALLTGIVAETNRFSNDKTKPKVMNTAAQLMAAGANQQLVASNLRNEGMINETLQKNFKKDMKIDNGEMVINKGDKSAKKVETTITDNNINSIDSNKDKKIYKSKPTPVLASEDPDSNGSNPAPKDSNKNLQNSNVNNYIKEGAPQKPSEPMNSDNSAERDASASAAPPSLHQLPQHTNAVSPAYSSDTQNKPTPTEEKYSKVDSDSPSNKEAIEEARKAVEEAKSSESFTPANQPLASINSVSMDESDVQLGAPAAIDAPQDGMASPQTMPSFSSDAVGSRDDTDVAKHSPPMPPVGLPMPPSLNSSTEDVFNPPASSGAMSEAVELGANQGQLNSTPSPMPPMPPMPSAAEGLGSSTPHLASGDITTSPQVAPEFMQHVPQSINHWTQAGEENADRQRDKDLQREQKIKKMSEQYDAAVERNSELQDHKSINTPTDPSNETPLS